MSYKRECQEKDLPFDSMPVFILSRHSAQLFERALPFREWSSSGRVPCFVSACEAEMRFLFSVVPFRCHCSANRFLKQQV